MKILNRLTGKTIFEFECISIKECVEEAVRQKINLSKAYLSGTDLSWTDLSGADLSGADLRGSDLRGANLIEADLRGANLIEADLRGANLSGANLRGANLRGANFSNSRFNDEELTKNPIYINSGLIYEVWIGDTKIKIGCQTHTTIAWSNFTDDQISKMDDGALEFWKQWKETILLLAKTHQG